LFSCGILIDGYFDWGIDEWLIFFNDVDFDCVDDVWVWCDVILVGVVIICYDNLCLFVWYLVCVEWCIVCGLE